MRIRVIAEIAQGYEGNFEQSKLLIKAASCAKADSVKFQVVYAEELATRDYEYFSLFKKLEMKKKEWKSLKKYAEELSIELIFDIFGKKSLLLASNLGINTIKIHSTDISNTMLLNAVSKSKIEKIILGIGGSSIEEITQAEKILNNKKLIFLHGFQGYPTKTEYNFLSRINLLRAKFNKKIIFGFADHEIKENFKFSLPLVSIGLGVRVIEKHLTLGKSMKLEDYESALNPDEFKEFVKLIRLTEKSIGISKDSSDFGMSKSEILYSKKVRRDIVASKKIFKGTILKPEHIILKRTSSPKSIQDPNKVYNKQINRTIEKDYPIRLKDLN